MSKTNFTPGGKAHRMLGHLYQHGLSSKEDLRPVIAKPGQTKSSVERVLFNMIAVIHRDGLIDRLEEGMEITAAGRHRLKELDDELQNTARPSVRIFAKEAAHGR